MIINSYQEFLERYRELRKQYMESCLWFEAEDTTEEPDAILNALRSIEIHGDREAFISARKLKQWLLPYYNQRSANL